MSTRQNDPDGPEDIDAAFAEIVAGLEDDPQFDRWSSPSSGDASGGDASGAEDSTAGSADAPPSAETASPGSGPRDWTPAEDPEDEHFVPPEPPPLKAPSGGAIGGVAVIAFGVLMLLVPGLAGLASPVTMPLGLVLVSAGIGWLLFRLRRGPSDHDDDDGARV
ncbi:hypothetical protein GCM10027174_22450 [Salinifilum aidingensis]